jgi:hypothetical protein
MSKEAERLAQAIEMLELMNDALRHLRTEVLSMNRKGPRLIINHLRTLRFMVPTHVKIFEVFPFQEPEDVRSDG